MVYIYIWVIIGVNVGKYTIHGVHGVENLEKSGLAGDCSTIFDPSISVGPEDPEGSWRHLK